MLYKTVATSKQYEIKYKASKTKNYTDTVLSISDVLSKNFRHRYGTIFFINQKHCLE